MLSPNVLTDPTLKNLLMAFNNSISLLCEVIIKQGTIVEPIALVLDFSIDTEKPKYFYKACKYVTISLVLSYFENQFNP